MWLTSAVSSERWLAAVRALSSGVASRTYWRLPLVTVSSWLTFRSPWPSLPPRSPVGDAAQEPAARCHRRTEGLQASPSSCVPDGQTNKQQSLIHTGPLVMIKVKDRVCFAPVFITYNKLYMCIASICCKTSVTSVLYH